MSLHMFRFLLVVFNKSVQLHSESVFLSNVTVKTANAFSYRYIMATESSNQFVAWGLKYTDLLEHSLIPHHNMGNGTVRESFNINQSRNDRRDSLWLQYERYKNIARP